MTTPFILGSTRAKSLFFSGCATLLITTASLSAQTSYSVVDLSAASGNYGAAYTASTGQAAGAASISPATYSGVAAVPYLLYPHATLWTGDGAADLHPAAVLGGDDTNSVSTVLGFAGNLQVGWGHGPNTQGLNVALAWRDTAASARVLALPAGGTNAQAFATDGTQIVGVASVNNRGSLGTHALVWNAATGAVTDLSDNGWVLGVARGQQAGYTFTSKGSVATVWTGTSRSQLVIHPKSADASQAYATDGVRQAGFSSVSVKVPAEGGAHGNVTRTVFSATVWSGTAASAVILSSYPFQQGFATGVSGSRVAGYAYNGYGLGTPDGYHALVWNAAGVAATDLNAFLPPGFVGAMANAVDAQGNIAGTIFTADGQQHAAFWMPNP